MDPKISVERLNAIEEEFRTSGKDIDTFLREKVNETGRPDADKVVDEIIATFITLDANYADLRKAKEEGYNRTDWLNAKLGGLLKSLNPKVAGEFLGRILNALQGRPHAAVADIEFSGRDAREIVKNLSDALEANEVRQITENADDLSFPSEE